MKGRAAMKAERLIRLTWAIAHGATVTSREIREQFGVSATMAERDLRQLEKVLHPDRKPAGKRWRVRVIGPPRRLVAQLGGDD